MLNFLLLISYCLIILAEKIYFFISEPKYAASILGGGNIVLLTLIIVFAAIAFVIEKKEDLPRIKIKKMDFVLISLIAITIITSFLLNFKKTSLEWDSIALYDARAKFLQNGIKFSQMVQFSKYDEISYYYLLYPPYTSIAHFFWESASTNISVSLYYSVYLLFFGTSLYFLSRNLLGDRVALFLTLLSISSKDIFVLSTIEYTNLPFTTSIVLSIVLLASYIKEPRVWKFLLGTFLLATSQWIRYLEPVWIVVIISFMISTFNKEKLNKYIIISLILIGTILLEYFSWGFFTRVIAGNPSPVNLSSNYLLGLLSGLINGKVFYVAFTYVKWIGILILGYGISLAIGIWNFKKFYKSKEILFIFLNLSLGLLFYFGVVYFSSIQGDWWQSLGGSIIRSSSFLIPISIFFILQLLSKNEEIKK